MKYLENLLSKIGIGRKDVIPAYRDRESLYVYIKCTRCKEIIPVRISLKEEVQENYDKSKEKSCAFFVRKEISGSGSNRCFARISIYLQFDSQFRVIGTEIDGGSFTSKDEFETWKKE